MCRPTWLANAPSSGFHPSCCRNVQGISLTQCLHKALHGHPDSGTVWEDHCTATLLQSGLKHVEAWRSCFYSEELKVFIIVYVDDFLCSGKPKCVREAWTKISALIRIGDPSAVGRFLGCKQEKVIDDIKTKVKFNMSDYMKQAVFQYKVAAGLSTSVPLPKVDTPFAPEPISDEDFSPGKHAVVAQSSLMKVLYAARTAVPYLMLPVNMLSRHLTRWTKHDDKGLLRMTSWIEHHDLA